MTRYYNQSETVCSSETDEDGVSRIYTETTVVSPDGPLFGEGFWTQFGFQTFRNTVKHFF